MIVIDGVGIFYDVFVAYSFIPSMIGFFLTRNVVFVENVNYK